MPRTVPPAADSIRTRQPHERLYDATDWFLADEFWMTRDARDLLNVARCRQRPATVARRPRTSRHRRARRVQRSSAASGDSGDGDSDPPPPHPEQGGAA